jgi:hypothetical protein
MELYSERTKKGGFPKEPPSIRPILFSADGRVDLADHLTLHVAATEGPTATVLLGHLLVVETAGRTAARATALDRHGSRNHRHRGGDDGSRGHRSSDGGRDEDAPLLAGDGQRAERTKNQTHNRLHRSSLQKRRSTTQRRSHSNPRETTRKALYKKIYGARRAIRGDFMTIIWEGWET